MHAGHPGDRSVTNQPATNQPAVDPAWAAAAGGTHRQPVDWSVTNQPATNQPATNQQTEDTKTWCINMDGLTFKPGRVFAMEIFCGSGRLTRHLRAAGLDAVGID